MSSKITPIGPHAEHEAILQTLRSVLKQMTPEMAANAFLYSLSTRALEYRAVLGSYWYAVAIPDHAPTDTWRCTICDWHRDWDLKPDYGLVDTNPRQCLLVLEHFLTLPPVRHTENDELLLQKVLQCVYALAPNQRGRALQKVITRSKILKSNAYEIDDLLNALGICGVLSSPRAPCYADRFCNIYVRNPETDSELLYPVNWWRARDGINRERYKTAFGQPFPGPIM